LFVCYIRQPAIIGVFLSPDLMSLVSVDPFV